MKLRLALFALLVSSAAFSQVTTQMVVEHFTNTNCGICGSRNPGLFTNLDNSNTDVIHVSYYPSSPYSDCKLHRHNSTENDARTRFYGLYGSTPQLAIQGEDQNRPNFNNKGLFDDFRGKSQPYTVKTTYTTTKDSILVLVKLFAKGIQSIDSLNLYTIVVEDTVFYKGRNSENEHYNVFRKALTNIEGDPIKTTITAKDSLMYRYSIALHKDWDPDRMYALAMVQNSFTKEIYQTGMGVKGNLVITSTPAIDSKREVQVYPSRVHDFIQVTGMSSGTYEVIGLQGQGITSGQLKASRINLSSLPKGLYIIRLNDGEEQVSSKIMKL